MTTGGRETGAIGPGATILCGVRKGDTAHDVAWLARKVSLLRCFNDADGKLNLSIREVGGAFLVVSQFTLYGDCAKGNRPSYIDAAGPDEGRAGYEAFVTELRGLGHEVRTGEFGADMLVEIENDGPVTLILESHGRTSS